MDFFLGFDIQNSKEQTCELIKQCYSISYCIVMFLGKLFLCERMASANAMHFIPDDKRDYVDVRKLSKKELKKAIVDFQHATYFPCCERCGTAGAIPPAEQIDKGEVLGYPIVY